MAITDGTGKSAYYYALHEPESKPWLQDLIRENWDEIVRLAEEEGGRFLDSGEE